MKSLYKIFLSLGVAAVASMGMTSCVGDLDLTPTNPSTKTDVTGDIDLAFSDIYLNFSTVGANGNTPVGGFDGGMATFQRAIFIAEEIPTDEAAWLWDPEKYGTFNYGYVTPTIPAVIGFYSRLTVNIALCNEFLQNVASGAYGVSADDATVKEYVRQVKTLRSICYFYMMSFYDKIPYADESTRIGTLAPQISRSEVYSNTVAVLEEVIAEYNALGNPKAKYGFVGVDVAEAALAKITLNAEVFRGLGDYEKCYKACTNIIGRLGNGGVYGNGLAYSYQALFGANNDKYAIGGANEVNEIIWDIVQDYPNLISYAGPYFLLAAWLNNSGVEVTLAKPTQEIYEDASEYHAKNEVYIKDDAEFKEKMEEYNKVLKDTKWKTVIDEEIEGVYYSFDPDANVHVSTQWYNAGDKWNALVARKSFVRKFDWDDADMSISKDRRVATWQTSKHGFTANNPSLAGADWGTNGYLCPKYTNWNYEDDGTTSAIQPEATGFVGGDYAAIRLAEIYLTAAEAILKGGGGSTDEALRYVNYIRQRAYGQDENGKDIYTPWTSLSMNDLQEERCRELYGENTRRTDLIRWNLWCKGYTWEWKGGIATGTNLPEYTKLYPIPSSIMVASNYDQMDGY